MYVLPFLADNHILTRMTTKFKKNQDKAINKSKKPKIVMLKIDILTFGNDYRVVSLFKMYLTAKVIIPESLK